MSEFEDKINQILSSPQAMEQIMSVARSLGIGNSQTASSPAPKPAAEPAEPAQNAASGLLSLLGGSDSNSGAGIDPKMASLMLRLVSAWNEPDDNKLALLEALRPFLKEGRAEKIQRAVQISKIARVVRIALEHFKGGDGDV
ncbi:MAG: hypothetical protein PHT34_04170 [Oscillospiraceae bacterium]|nr:hypothetical protein [Oscillospiraceae bacterium]